MIQLLVLLVGFVILAPATARSAEPQSAARVFVLDGSAVHDVGSVQLHMTNWGLIGSTPGLSTSFGEAPSFEYPAGSGMDHLYAAGLWVGGLVDGTARVSTGQYVSELLPDPDDERDTIYQSAEAQRGQRRFPMGNADDDHDGMEDEDPLDGRDNDQDGLIDEDGAAIGDQYFRASMRDDTELSQEISPDHAPMGIQVERESFQWADPRFDDFVGMRYTITNRGSSLIEALHLGMFADFDIGLPSNDWVRFHDGPVAAYDGSMVDVQLARVHSSGNEGVYAGVVLASPDLRASGFQAWVGNLPYAQGGDPTNDFERYQSLTARDFDFGNRNSNDVRFLLAADSGRDLAPGESLTFDLAFVIGETRDELIANAANAVRLAHGGLVDRDHDKTTGIDGREFRVPWIEAKGRLKDKSRGGFGLTARPNPLNPRTEILFALPESGAIRIEVFDARGRRVDTLLDSVVASGPGRIVWGGTDSSGRGVSSGVYFVRIQQGGSSETIRAVVVR